MKLHVCRIGDIAQGHGLSDVTRGSGRCMRPEVAGPICEEVARTAGFPPQAGSGKVRNIPECRSGCGSMMHSDA